MTRGADVGGRALAVGNYRSVAPKSVAGFKPSVVTASVFPMELAAFQERAPWRANLFPATSCHSARDKAYAEVGGQNFIEEHGHVRAARPPRRMPTAWGALLSREDLADYLAMSVSTLVRILPVPPLDLGVRGVRYRRADIDGWLATLPVQGEENRSLRPVAGAEDDAVAIAHHPSTALERVLARSVRSRNREDVVA